MKKKVAIFANGWSDEYIKLVLDGVRRCAQENSVDVFLFIEFSSGDSDVENRGEANIIQLPDLADFDGVMLLANTFNYQEVARYLQEEIVRIGLPAVSLNYELDGIDFLGTENYPGMYDLAVHMLDVHGAKDILFIGGFRDNQESQERCRAVKDAMSERGLELTEENIIYGDFSDVHVVEVLDEWMEEYDRLPDAIICANDVMAMGTCLWLDNHGYRVPEDVGVTGYDCIESARFCFPSITTVAKEGEKAGYDGLQHLLDKMEGKEVWKRSTVPSKFVQAESCGCVEDAQQAANSSIFHSTYGKKRENMDFDSHNRVLYRYIRGIKTEEEICRAMEWYFRGSHSFEGDSFALCLTDNFFTTIKAGEDLAREGYTEKMQTLFWMRDNEPMPRSTYATSELVPGYDGNSPEEHIYLFAPLHSEDMCMGYVMFCDREGVLDSYRLYTWTRHMVQALEQARLNIRLEEMNKRLTEISVQDALTGVYNRLGYEKYAIPYLEECWHSGRHGVMIFADINRMKTINDQYGHLQGDVAICTVAATLKQAMPEGSVVVRYGGDEFLAAGSCDTEEEVMQLEEKINEELAREIEKRKIIFDLSVSVGIVPLDTDRTLSIEECFKKADASMYKTKKKQHEKQAEG